MPRRWAAASDTPVPPSLLDVMGWGALDMGAPRASVSHLPAPLPGEGCHQDEGPCPLRGPQNSPGCPTLGTAEIKATLITDVPLSSATMLPADL